ncbi:MAG TPA: twin-arginine translocation signal domain-containing protein, partial [Gemmatimonadaceae bacterium]|nr:twin-arginine translocation signal domain-containing protein [Gemmatimonadaceae bacterium]
MTESRVPRRDFLATSAATVAGAVLGVGAVPRVVEALTVSHDAAPLKTAAGAIKLGIASYSLRKFPLEKALEMMKALGTPYVNFKSVHAPYEASPQERAATRQRIQDAGFRIVGGGTIDFTKDDDDDV